jgi:hypothetical protein
MRLQRCVVHGFFIGFPFAVPTGTSALPGNGGIGNTKVLVPISEGKEARVKNVSLDFGEKDD